jgi:phosphopantothenoylcysteine decarboxylase/phosphopantothenate--cysteine ligase
LAGGDVGAGRLASPEVVVAAVERVLGPKDLDSWRVLVSAGGTREPIDPVRVITNRSSGKQGYALAAAAADRGAKVTLVTTVAGSLSAPAGVEVVEVGSAAEMEAAIVPRSSEFDAIIMAAAVADFRVATPADHKLKKSGGSVPALELSPTHDFLVDLGSSKPAGQVLVGFAAETDDVLGSAREKLARKRLDLIVANDVSAPGVGFEHDTNAVTILFADGREHPVELSTKRQIADAVLDAVVSVRAGR